MGSIASSNPITGGIEDEHKMNLEAAKATEADAQYNAVQRRKQADRLMKDQVAAIGSSGVELSGSVLDQVKQDQMDAELEAMNIVYSGKMQAGRMRRQSHMNRRQGYLSLAKDGAMFAASSGAFSGGGAKPAPTTPKSNTTAVNYTGTKSGNIA